MPRYNTVETLQSTYINQRLELFWKQSPQLNTSEYSFHQPHIEIANVDPCTLFKECYKPHIHDERSNQLPEKVASNKKACKNKAALKIAGTIPDIIQNAGINTLVFNIDNGIGSQEFRDSVAQLKSIVVKLPHDLKEKRFKSLQEARVRLSQALNINEALAKLRETLFKQVTASCEVRQRKADEIIELLAKSKTQTTVTDELIQLYDELKVSLGKVSKGNELSQVINALGENVTYQKMLDDLDSLEEQGKPHSFDSEFYLELMGCDWARYVKTINDDIKCSIFD